MGSPWWHGPWCLKELLQRSCHFPFPLRCPAKNHLNLGVSSLNSGLSLGVSSLKLRLTVSRTAANSVTLDLIFTLGSSLPIPLQCPARFRASARAPVASFGGQIAASPYKSPKCPETRNEVEGAKNYKDV